MTVSYSDVVNMTDNHHTSYYRSFEARVVFVACWIGCTLLYEQVEVGVEERPRFLQVGSHRRSAVRFSGWLCSTAKRCYQRPDEESDQVVFSIRLSCFAKCERRICYRSAQTLKRIIPTV